MTRQESFDNTIALFQDFATLREGFVVDVSNDYGFNDLRKLANFQERLFALSRLILTESFFAQLNDEIDDERSLFLSQKKAKNFFDEVMLNYINDLIIISKQWDFHDYRAIDLQRDTKKLMTEIKDFYAEMYQ